MTYHDYSLAIFSAELAGDTQEVARLKRAKQTRSDMNSYETRFKEAIARLNKDLDPPARELQVFESEAQTAVDQGRPYPPKYYRDMRDKIIGRIAYGEMQARAAFTEARDEALAEARQTRAAAEAGRDPQARIAEELERARLIGSAAKSADALATEAQAVLAAGQPRRAEFLLAVAVDKGWKGGVRYDSATGRQVGTLSELRQSIADAIDSAEPDRRAARSLEETVAAAAFQFAQERKAALAKFGIGVLADGSIGSGHPSEVARASLSAKVAAHRAGVAEPAGLLASAPTGDPLRSKADS